MWAGRCVCGLVGVCVIIQGCIHLPTYKESAVDMDDHVYTCGKECLIKNESAGV